MDIYSIDGIDSHCIHDDSIDIEHTQIEYKLVQYVDTLRIDTWSTYKTNIDVLIMTGSSQQPLATPCLCCLIENKMINIIIPLCVVVEKYDLSLLENPRRKITPLHDIQLHKIVRSFTQYRTIHTMTL